MIVGSKLIDLLEAAPEGSRELDVEIAVATFEGRSSVENLLYARKPHADDHCSAGTFWRQSRSGASLKIAPHFTTSLDAKLPGENIVATELCPDGLWVAIDKRGAQETVGKANTEPLARRIAALKARGTKT